MKNSEQLNALFEKYLNNRCTTEELNTLLQYFGNPDCKEIVKGLIYENLEKTGQQDIGYHSSQRAVQEVYSLLHDEIQKEKKEGVKRLIPSGWRLVAALWVILLSSISLSIYYWNDYFNMPGKPLEQFITKRGERAKIKLADGTQVWLSPQSKIEYPKKFHGNTREVLLSGEAFFDVAKDKNHSFIIHCGTLSTKVVGTSFNIEAYDDQTEANVTVLSGKVNVSVDHPSQIKRNVDLEANQRVVFDKNKQLFEKESYPDASQFIREREGKFEYNGTPVNLVLEELERQYGVVINVDGDLKQCKFYGELNATEDLHKFLRKVSLVINAKWHYEQGIYKITATGC